MALKRTAVRSSTRNRLVSGTPLATFYDTPQTAAAPPTSEPWQDRIAREAATKTNDRQYEYEKWLMQQEASLQQKRDADALSRLRDGDFSYFIDYSNRRSVETQGDEHDYWSQLHDRAITGAQDQTISGLIAAGDMNLEELRTVLLERRDKAKLGDPSFLAVNKQIAQVNQAIQADKFNKVISQAYADYSESGNAKPYLDTLVALLPYARDDKMRTDLYGQIKTLRTEVEKEQQNRDAQEVSAAVIDFQNDPSHEGDLLAMLADKARNAKDPAEAQRYVSLAGQVVARARQIQQDALRGSGGGGGGGASTAFKKAVDAMMQSGRNNYDDAVDRIQKIVRNGDVPTADDWAVFWAAGDRVREGAQLAISKGASGTVLDSLLKEVRNVDEQRDIQKKAAGAQVIQQANDEITRMGDRLKGVKSLDTIISASTPTIERIKKLADSVYLTDAQRADMQQKIVLAERPAREKYDAAIAAMRDPTLTDSYKAARNEFDKYLQAYEQIHGNLSGAADFDRWRSVIGNDATTVEQKGGELGVFTKGAEGNPFQAADAGKWGSQTYNADNITKATAVKRAASEEASGYLNDITTGAKMFAPGWLAEEIISGRPDESGNAARMAAAMHHGPGATIDASGLPTEVGRAMYPGAGYEGPPDPNEMRAENLAARRASAAGGPAPKQNDIFPEDQIISQWSDVSPYLDPGFVDTGAAPTPPTPQNGIVAGPGVFTGTPPSGGGGVFDPGFVDQAQPLPAQPFNESGFDFGTQGGAAGAASGSSAAFDPGFTDTTTPIGQGEPSWLSAFNMLDRGFEVQFPAFTLPDLHEQPAFDFPSLPDIAPIPSFNFSGPSLDTGITDAPQQDTSYTPPTDMAGYGPRLY